MTERPIPQRLVEAARRSADHRRPLTEPELRRRFGDPTTTDITVGQVWRARWEQLAGLVLVVHVGDREVEVVPVTIDPPIEDELSVVVDGASTAFGVDATAWNGLRSAIPIRVLDRPIDDWGAAMAEAVVAAERDRTWATEVPIRPGQQIDSDLNPDAMFRAELTDNVHDLASVSMLPASKDTDEQQTTTLRMLLANRLNLGLLCTTLNMRQPLVMRLLNGKLPLKPAQLDLVAAATKLPVDVIRASVHPLPYGLAIAAEHPRWRPNWTQRANDLGLSEAEAQLEGAYGVFATAARQTGSNEPDWHARLRHYFQDTSSNPGGT